MINDMTTIVRTSQRLQVLSMGNEPECRKCKRLAVALSIAASGWTGYGEHAGLVAFDEQDGEFFLGREAEGAKTPAAEPENEGPKPTPVLPNKATSRDRQQGGEQNAGVITPAGSQWPPEELQEPPGVLHRQRGGTQMHPQRRIDGSSPVSGPFNR
jgi:hypothetical protein